MENCLLSIKLNNYVVELLFKKKTTPPHLLLTNQTQSPGGDLWQRTVLLRKI